MGMVKRMAKENKPPIAPAAFIETMECLAESKVPQGPEWTYEVKLDGYRLEAVKTNGRVTVYSRRRNAQGPLAKPANQRARC